MKYTKWWHKRERMMRVVARLVLGVLLLSAVLLATRMVLAQVSTTISVASSRTGSSVAPEPTIQILFGTPGPEAPADTKETATVSCPPGWRLLTGGFRVPDLNNGTGTITDVNESSASASTVNGITTWSWTVIYRNTGGGKVHAQAQIVCQQPAPPQELHVLTVVGPRVSSGPGASSAHAAATCPPGTLLTGGGYAFQTGGETAHVSDNRSVDGHAWQVAVFTPDAAISFDAYAYCASLS